MISVFHWLSWGSFNNVVWFLLILIGCAIVVYLYRKHVVAYSLLAGKHFVLLRNMSSKKQKARVVLLCGGLIFLFIALLRPQWNKSEETIMQEGRDLYIG